MGGKRDQLQNIKEIFVGTILFDPGDKLPLFKILSTGQKVLNGDTPCLKK